MKIFYTLFLIPTIVTAQLNYFNALRFKENLHLYESNIIKPNYDQLNLNENITGLFESIVQEEDIKKSKKNRYNFNKHIDEISFLINKINGEPNDTRIDKIELSKIVIPEYIFYNSKRDSFEKYLIKFNYLSRKERYKTISFGPFQMQVDFIKKNTHLLNYEDIIYKLDSLSDFKSQFGILKQFVKNNPELTLRELINKSDPNSKLS